LTADDPAGSLTRRHLTEWAWFLIVLGAVLRFQGLDWGRGMVLNPDERNIASAAALLTYPHALVPQFHAYNGLALYLPRLLAELISPLTGRSGTDVAAIAIAGRLLSAFCATLTLPLLWSTARRIFGIETALFVVASAAFAPALIQSAHFATTESGLVLCLAMLVWLSVRQASGVLRLTSFALLSGAVLGLGFGLKTTALALAIIPATAIVGAAWCQSRVMPAAKAAATVALVAIAIGLATTPQIWTDPAAYFTTMRFESAVVWGTADVFWTYQFLGASNGLFELSQLPWLVGPAVAPLGIAGLVALLFGVWRGEEAARRLTAAACFAIVYAMIVCLWHAKFVRYLTLLVPLLVLFTGYFAAQIAGARLRRRVMVVAGIATGAAGLLQASIYQLVDPRIAAWEWLVPHLRAGDRLIVEPHDVGPPYWVPQATPIDTETLPLLDPSSPVKLREIAQALAKGRWMIIASRRHYRVLPRMQVRFPEMCGYYDALWSGRLGYGPVAKFGRRPALASTLSPEVQAEETFTVFDSPEVIVLAKVKQLPAAELAAAILSLSPECTPQVGH
jgi:4-amino-4-deoxy-L-arabinose transferase-like glycosyltransferase